VLDLASATKANLSRTLLNPTYARGGKLIAVDASWAGPRRIWVLDSEGHNPQQVTTDTSEEVAHVGPLVSRWQEDRLPEPRANRSFDIRVVSLDQNR